MKSVFFVVIIIIIGLLGSLRLNSPQPIVVENYRQYRCNYQDPIKSVQEHFSRPIHKSLIKEYKPSGVDEDGIVISGYTWFGIEINRAHYSCDGIRVIKNF